MKYLIILSVILLFPIGLVYAQTYEENLELLKNADRYYLNLQHIMDSCGMQLGGDTWTEELNDLCLSFYFDLGNTLKSLFNNHSDTIDKILYN